MLLIDRKTRCFVCDKVMQIGEQFVWGSLRAQGTNRTLPMHPEHDPIFVQQKQMMRQVLDEAAANGHDDPDLHMIGEVRMADQSILIGLKNEIAQSRTWGKNTVSIERLENLIRTHEVQIPEVPANIPPTPRYELVLEITGNTMYKLEDVLETVVTNLDIAIRQGRTTMEIVSGAGFTLTIREPNPDMTEDKYKEELHAWSEARHQRH